MLVITKIVELQLFLAEKRDQNELIGFVPTMGAIHLGHLSLIKISKRQTDITICSIFVNPTQFNDKTDLEKYPRMPKQDADMLKTVNCDVLFLPDVDEVYPQKDIRVFDFGYLDTVLEGALRPGHYNGVAQVVSRLFAIVKPNIAFFGIKDYQQVLVVKSLVKQLQLDIKIVASPILRDADGLAMSSRNLLLNADERKAAQLLNGLLQKSLVFKKEGKAVSEIKHYVTNELSKNRVYKLDYFAICEDDTLKEVEEFSESSSYVFLIACYVGKIRLIDNIQSN